jgi:hypothetical protein
MVDLIKKHIHFLKEFERQRIAWLRLSGFVALSILLIIIEWNQIESYQLIWLIVMIGLILAVSWWYWTFILIRKLITHKMLEYQILDDIISEIREIKIEIKK